MIEEQKRFVVVCTSQASVFPQMYTDSRDAAAAVALAKAERYPEHTYEVCELTTVSRVEHAGVITHSIERLDTQQSEK